MTFEQQGILTGNEIVDQIERGHIRIDPFRPERVNPASYDLTLGRHVAVYADVVSGTFERKLMPNGRWLAGANLGPYPLVDKWSRVHVIDVKKPNNVLRYEMEDNIPLVLLPGIGYLMHTEERVWTDTFEPILDGKSSIGRLFVKVHETAGFGDPHFDGQYTLEVTAMHPVLVYPGMRFCQIRFHTMVGEVTPYHGNYTGQQAIGPVPSRSWRMFQP